MKGKIWATALAVMFLATGVHAGGKGAVRKQIESSMVFTGMVDIEPDGHVSGYTLDRPEALPPVVAKIMDRATKTWTFEPPKVDGKIVRARTAMSVRLVATRNPEDGSFGVRLASANFGRPAKDEFVSGKALTPPRYPKVAAMSNASGTVYLVLRVGRDGRVEDVMAEQVNLTVIDSENGMKRWRDSFARAAVDGARSWTFDVPTRGEDVDAPFWLARVPVTFHVNNGPVAYGQWDAYIPGPRETAPWLGGMDASLGSDAVADGGIYPVGNYGPKLLTPLDGA